MNLKLGKYELEIKETINYGDKCDIEEVFLQGVKGVSGEFDTSVMRKAKLKTLEIFITSIKEGEKAIPFTEEWLRALPSEDGDKLVDTVNGLKDKKKA